MNASYSKIAIVLITTLFSFYSCNNDKKKESVTDNTIILELDEANFTDNLTYYRFPSPEEIFEYIKLTGINYSDELVNPAYYHDKYTDTYSQTINMGIYISDLAYITMFNQQEKSLDYFEAIHYLSEAIRISSAFEDPLLNRISDNIDNVDSLVIIASDAYQDIVDYLVDNDMENKLSVLSISAFIESLYITLSYIDVYDANSEMIKRLVDQKYALSNLYEYSMQYEKDKNVKKAIVPISALKEIFDNLQPEKQTSTKVENKGNKLILSGGTKYVISEEEFTKLKQIINDARAEFIKF
ncbi:MAG: hypothetical protein JEZ09_05100 [Salinivirgaceae bacterium]|nr:hypothetical protein [Salinivirgaceae bacterium]